MLLQTMLSAPPCVSLTAVESLKYSVQLSWDELGTRNNLMLWAGSIMIMEVGSNLFLTRSEF